MLILQESALERSSSPICWLLQSKDWNAYTSHNPVFSISSMFFYFHLCLSLLDDLILSGTWAGWFVPRECLTCCQCYESLVNPSPRGAPFLPRFRLWVELQCCSWGKLLSTQTYTHACTLENNDYVNHMLLNEIISCLFSPDVMSASAKLLQKICLYQKD